MDEKEIESFRSDGKILLSNSCGPYRHHVAECQDSWINIVKRKTSQFNIKLMGQSDEDKLKGEENRSRESLELGKVCGVSVDNKQVAGEVTQPKIVFHKLES